MNNEYTQDLAAIRQIMEKRTKFLSLSGLSGILAGIYALVGAFMAFGIIGTSTRTGSYNRSTDQEYGNLAAIFIDPVYFKLLSIAVIVLIAALATGLILSYRKASSNGQSFWNPAAKMMLWSLGVPLFTGGIFILVLLMRNEVGLIGPASLIFYGLALFSGGVYTYSDIKNLGLVEIILGSISLFFPGYGLYFWAFGFGILHILYGSIMYFKYER